MKNKIRVLSLIVILMAVRINCIAQDSAEIIKGDLYFDFFRVGSFYKQPDSIVQKFKTYADTANPAYANGEKLLIIYNVLKRENILFQPFIDLKLDNDSLVKVYFSDVDIYERIKAFKYKELIERKKKVRLILKIIKLSDGMVLCKNLISANKVKGQTFQASRKYKVEDYQ